jgi:hypothetical protein
MSSLKLRLEMGHIVIGWLLQISPTGQAYGPAVPHSWFCIEQLVPSGGHGAPASSVSPPSPWQFVETTGGPQVGYHFRPVLPPELDELLPEPDELPPELDELPPELEELPPELDDPAHDPVTT